MKKVELLAQLQRTDTTLGRARERLDQVVVELADQAALAAARAQHQADQAELHRRHGEQRDLELEVDDLRGRLAMIDKKLYGGTVRIPKELQDLARDADQLRSLISTREDRLIALFDEVAAATEAELASAQRLRDAEAAELVGKQALRAERDALRAEIAAAEREQLRLRASADASSLRLYDGLRRTRGGLVVAELAQRTCQGCRVAVPQQDAIRARTSEELVLCSSCGRVLHATY